MDPRHQGVAQFLQGSYFIQIVCTDGDIGDLSGDLCALADGNTNICRRQCRGIVDAVTDHNDFMTCLLLLLHEPCFVLRQHLGIILIHADGTRNCPSDTVAVSCHHDYLVDSETLQLSDDLRSLFSERILDADHCSQLAVNCHIQAGVFLRQLVEQLLSALRNLCLLILKYEMVAADDDLLAFQSGRDSMRYNIFHFGMQFFMYQLLAGCFPHHCLCHGMREMLLQAGGDPKQFLCWLSVKGYHIRHGRLCLGQCSGLVKYNGGGICHSL